MPRTSTNGNGNGNGQNHQVSIAEELRGDTQPTQSAGFTLNADATIGSLLNASDQDFDALINQLTRKRQLTIQERARKVANLLNPQLQMEEVMVEAQRIVDVETAGVAPTGHTLPSLRLMGGA